MPSLNEYPGYVKLPKKKLYNAKIRLDFNAQITSGPEPGTEKLHRFVLRLFTKGKSFKSQREQPEMSVDLRPEEWLDLIDAMKEEYELAVKSLKDFDNLNGP